MIDHPKSIEEQIACLARLTGAPGSFVEQVRALFTMKGISLEANAEPFLGALEEAFRREEHIRASSNRARNQIVRLRENFRKVGQAYVDQLAQLRQTQSSLQRHSHRQQKKAAARRSTTTRVTISGNHRSLVTPTVHEELPLVPGPREQQ